MRDRIDISISPSTGLDGFELIARGLDLKLLHKAGEGHHVRGKYLNTPPHSDEDLGMLMIACLVKGPPFRGQKKNNQSILVSRRPARLILGLQLS